MERQRERRVRLPKDPGSELRSAARFPLNLEVRYSAAERRGPLVTGSGRTIDVSSSGLAFTADVALPVGQKLEVNIDWPVPLDGGVQLQLVTSGVVVRSSGTATALRIQHHEFKTRRPGPRAVPRRVG